MTFLELLDEIANRPAMFLGEPTIVRLEAFLLGWMLASDDEEARQYMQGFQNWIATRYHITSSHSWANIIRFYASDDVSALTDALKLFQEYRSTALCKN